MMHAHSQDSERLERAVALVLDAARELGADAAEAAGTVESGLSVTVRLGEVETLERHLDHSFGISVYFGRRKGSASTSDLSDEGLRKSVEAACSLARFTAEDPCAGLAPAERMATDVPDLDLLHPWDLDAEGALAIAKRCEDTARGLDERVTNSDGATVNSHLGASCYGNTHGFSGHFASSRHSISCSVIAADERGMQRDYWYTVSRVPTELEDPEAVGRRAAERTLRRLNGKRISTREAPVILAPEIARSLFGHLVAAIRGGALYRKASFLLDQVGEQIFPSWLRIHEQPHLPAALGSAPYDNEGVATLPRDVVSGGVLRGYVLDSYSGCKLGLPTTGNAGGVFNLTVDPGPDGAPDPVSGLDRGLLVTELMGQAVNLVTGDYSRGAAGFWIENGEIVHPVEEITIAGNLKDMFQGIVAVGSDVDLRGNIRTGSVLIDRMTIAGE
jgi:PmbA protein